MRPPREWKIIATTVGRELHRHGFPRDFLKLESTFWHIQSPWPDIATWEFVSMGYNHAAIMDSLRLFGEDDDWRRRRDDPFDVWIDDGKEAAGIIDFWRRGSRHARSVLALEALGSARDPPSDALWRDVARWNGNSPASTALGFETDEWQRRYSEWRIGCCTCFQIAPCSHCTETPLGEVTGGSWITCDG